MEVRVMEWDAYYKKFDEWATSTQISRLSALTSYGPSDEVAEVAQGLMDETAASRLIRRALAAGGGDLRAGELLQCGGDECAFGKFDLRLHTRAA